MSARRMCIDRIGLTGRSNVQRPDDLIYRKSGNNQPDTVKGHDRRFRNTPNNRHAGLRTLRHEQGTVITDCGISLLLHLLEIFPQTPPR